jgi:4-hydroxy-2-oxoglutarate aldolase
MSVGGGGCITGLANVYPKTCMELYSLWTKGKREEAERLQLQLAAAEWGFAKGGINGTKWIVAKKLGYPESSSACRRPYPLYADAEKQAWISKIVEPLAKIESRLSNP